MAARSKVKKHDDHGAKEKGTKRQG